MKMKKLPDGKRTTTYRRIEIDGHVFDAEELEDLLWYGLDGTDGCFTAVNIHGKELREILEKLKIIRTNIRGGSYRGQNYEEAKELFHKAMYEDDKK